MNFSNKLRAARKDKGITQEELAEVLSVSRQAVSNWESEQGYPETEKLIELAKTLDVSIDYLLVNEKEQSGVGEKSAVYTNGGAITIQTFDKKSVVNCIAVKTSKILIAKEGEPRYILVGVSRIGFWGENSITLGWYDSLEAIQLEMDSIMRAIEASKTAYQLQYNVDIEFVGFFGQPRIIDDK